MDLNFNYLFSISITTYHDRIGQKIIYEKK
jgi:hypothetical protein